MADSKGSWAGTQAILNQLIEIARISALQEMASGIAHELNQPLGAIATFSQAGERMLNRPAPMVERALDVFRQINQEALGAGEGIQRIRRIFEREAWNRTQCRMSELVSELWPVLEVLTASCKGTLKLEEQPSLPEVVVDRLRVQHVLFALVQNAVDASSHAANSSILIDLSASRYFVETGVTDSGKGVAADIKEHLFRPFFTTKHHGTGLGLASSRAVIESHEGSIGFDNLPAGGSRFWFRLPVAQAHPEEGATG